MQDYVNYINGTWKKASIATVPINDSGFLLGDGLFETIRFDNKTLFKPEKHLERLCLGLQIIHIGLEISDAEIQRYLTKLFKKMNLSQAYFD